MRDEIKNLTIEAVIDKLSQKKFSAVELVKSCLKNIKEKESVLAAFLSVDEKLALQQAEIADQQIEQLTKDNLPELIGVPIAIKDNILVEGMPCTAGSKILKNYIAPYNATVIKKLSQAGAIIIGKTNLDEFAMGSSTENSAFQTTKNPIDLERVPGGSSGGSAAAVAGGEVICALGSETGGSIRQPASFCGIVGLKPTYGSVSRFGLIAFASSIDQIGPLTKTVSGAKRIFRAIRGIDSNDSTTKVFPENNKKTLSLKEIRVGIPREYFTGEVDKRVASLVKKVISQLEKEKVKMIEVSLPHTKYALPAYYIIAPSEASANLARYDGIRYGCPAKAETLSDLYFKSRGEGFGSEVKRRIMLGTYSLSAGYYDAYYKRAQKVRELIKRDFTQAFQKVDFLLTPTTPSPAFKIGERNQDPVQMYLSDLLNAPANLAGIPALSLPVGSVDNLPIGLQIIGPSFSEERIFSFAEQIEPHFFQ